MANNFKFNFKYYKRNYLQTLGIKEQNKIHFRYKLKESRAIIFKI